MNNDDLYEFWIKHNEIIKENKKICKTRSDRIRFVCNEFKKEHGYDIDLNNCTKFNEKLYLRRLYPDKKYYVCADKVKVRSYVSKKIGDQYLIKQYLVKRKISVRDLLKLPDSFAIKTNNASGTNIIVDSKKNFDLNKIVQEMNFYTKIKFGYLFGEFHYNKIKPKIIAEQLLTDSKGNVPDDFKVHCFNNGVEKHRFYECFYYENGVRLKDIYDENWNKVDFKFSLNPGNQNIEKPEKFDEINYICDKLSEDFNYVRVDLYILQGKIYFGELTFTPAAGNGKFDPEEVDEIWGSYMGDIQKK